MELIVPRSRWREGDWRRGQILLETAVTLPLLLLFLSVMVESGWYLLLSFRMEEGVKAGVMAVLNTPGACSLPDDALVAHVRKAMADVLGGGKEWTVRVEVARSEAGRELVMEVSREYRTPFGLLGNFLHARRLSDGVRVFVGGAG